MQLKRQVYQVRYFSTRQRRRRGRASPCQIASLRLNDLARLFRARYGVVMPDDDAGRDDIAVAVNHLASLPRPKGRIHAWLCLWCPWMTIADQERITAAAIMHQQHWTADQLAWRLRLTDADRTALGITTIGAIDCSKRQRTMRRKARQKANAKAWRARKKTAYTP